MNNARPLRAGQAVLLTKQISTDFSDIWPAGTQATVRGTYDGVVVIYNLKFGRRRHPGNLMVNRSAVEPAPAPKLTPQRRRG